jgi:hypothetical protein
LKAPAPQAASAPDALFCRHMRTGGFTVTADGAASGHDNLYSADLTCLLARQAHVIGQDDARPGQQLPAPGNARPCQLADVQGRATRQQKLTSR